MEPPVTPKPMPASSPDLPTDHTGKLFGIVYITFTGVIDTIILATSLWSCVVKSVSYLFNLAPLLWWALPTQNLAQFIPENNGLADQDWIPDTIVEIWLVSGIFLTPDTLQGRLALGRLPPNFEAIVVSLDKLCLGGVRNISDINQISIKVPIWGKKIILSLKKSQYELYFPLSNVENKIKVKTEL
ncbi:hypothetical protein DSO57_1004916 [Entomophthora muscae]|uniref:Uncharacterized protein n=1 Tax=Entomophthora muscae TaxID=34485 RepID=A0ACC2SKR3_9FUNG|nr:hypothetical protein DSO57_1004916 [Entomophthora muscae]